MKILHSNIFNNNNFLSSLTNRSTHCCVWQTLSQEAGSCQKISVLSGIQTPVSKSFVWYPKPVNNKSCLVTKNCINRKPGKTRSRRQNNDNKILVYLKWIIFVVYVSMPGLPFRWSAQIQRLLFCQMASHQHPIP